MVAVTLQWLTGIIQRYSCPTKTDTDTHRGPIFGRTRKPDFRCTSNRLYGPVDGDHNQKKGTGCSGRANDDMEDVIQGYYYQTTNLYHFLSPPSTIPSLLSSVKFCLLRPDLSTPSLPPPLKALYNIRRGTTAKSSGILKLSLMRFASATLVVVVACQNGLTRKWIFWRLAQVPKNANYSPSSGPHKSDVKMGPGITNNFCKYLMGYPFLKSHTRLTRLPQSHHRFTCATDPWRHGEKSEESTAGRDQPCPGKPQGVC